MSTATQLGLQFRDAAASRHAGEIARLVPLVQRLARDAGSVGITVTEVRIAAGLTAGANRAAYSWLGGLMKAAGLEPTGTFRRSTLDCTHGNRQVVWRVPG